ncbi:hypothetical protein [Ekhidna sp.]|uniref:hypothetical protein n=1 Tax=Ekhidna sp. TaxID=2608089 RepID=UPI003299D6E8
MKFLFIKLSLLMAFSSLEVNAQQKSMEEHIKSFGNESYAIQIQGHTSLVVIGTEVILMHLTIPEDCEVHQMHKKLLPQSITYNLNVSNHSIIANTLGTLAV